MMIYRIIAPLWLKPNVKYSSFDGRFTNEQIQEFNKQGFSIYYLPNYPSSYEDGTTVDGSMIDTWEWVFVDFDLKEGQFKSKEDFLVQALDKGLEPTKVIDSGHGIHIYWRVTNLDGMSFLRLQRRLCRFFNTDENVSKILQLMRHPGTVNTKNKDNPVNCVQLLETTNTYTAEYLDKFLPPITLEDEEYCKNHYNKTHNLDDSSYVVTDELPEKFGKLLRENQEAREIFTGPTDDRSKGDFRLAHIMFGNGFNKTEAASVLVNTAKALQRAPKHRITYATNIIDKIWTFEETQDLTNLSPTVRDILSKGEDTLVGTRFPCNRMIDDTVHGFRLGQVLGIIGGSGVGKTTLTLNTFLWFAENNPDYHHFFFSLEQPPGEIASRIKTICQGNDSLYDKIHIVSNYERDGTFKYLSMLDIQEHLVKFQEETNHKVGAVVVDHIGVLSKSVKHGESEGLQGICRQMKAVAVKLNILLIMLSQAPREKAGIGDLELNKDAAFGTSYFENFVDFLLCLWQPLKRAYNQGAPTVMAFKFAKIRHKKQNEDRIKEDICYQFYFDPETERLRELTQDEEKSASYFLSVATNLRKLDKKTDVIPYQSRRVSDP